MKFQIDNENLLQGLGRIQAIVERRSTLPILSNVLIKADGDGITLAATDLEVGVVSTHPAEIERGGSVTLAAKKLFEIVRELDESEVHVALDMHPGHPRRPEAYPAPLRPRYNQPCEKSFQ